MIIDVVIFITSVVFNVGVDGVDTVDVGVFIRVEVVGFTMVEVCSESKK